MEDSARSGTEKPTKRSRADVTKETESKTDVECAQEKINVAMESIMQSLSPVEDVALRAVILQPSDCKRINTFLAKCMSERSEVTLNMVASTADAASSMRKRAVGRMIISSNNGKAYLQLTTNVILCGKAVARAIEEHPEGGSWVLLDQNLHVKSVKTMSSVMSERMPAVIDVVDTTATSMTMVCNDENNTVVEFRFCTKTPHADDTRASYMLQYDYVMHLDSEKLRSMLKDMGSNGNMGIEILTQHAKDTAGRDVTMRHMRLIGGDDDCILARKAQFICKRRNVVDTATGDVKVSKYWEYCEDGSTGDLFAHAPIIPRARITTKLSYLQLLCQNVPSDRAIILYLGMIPNDGGYMPLMVKVPYSTDASSASLVKMLILTNENIEDDFKHFDTTVPITPEVDEDDAMESKSETNSGIQRYQIEDIDNPDVMADFNEYCCNPEASGLDTAAAAFGPDDEEDITPPSPPASVAPSAL